MLPTRIVFDTETEEPGTACLRKHHRSAQDVIFDAASRDAAFKTALTSMWLPTGLGADPHVWTTVAMAIGAPIQRSAQASNLSSSAMDAAYRMAKHIGLAGNDPFCIGLTVNGAE